MDSQYVYALGTVIARFPNMSLEKEFVQAVKHEDVHRIDERAIQYDILNRSHYRYIARDMCWVFSIQNVDTYILEPQTDGELQQLIDMLSKDPEDIYIQHGAADVDVVIGELGPIASPEKCNGLQIPVVIVNHTYSFKVQEFLDGISIELGPGHSLSPDQVNELKLKVLSMLMQLADNVGNLDEHRAINYLALRYPKVYEQTILESQQDNSLHGVSAQMSRLNANGTRRIVDIIFTYSNKSSDVKTRFYASVDVGGMFPFLMDRLQPYYERPNF